MPRHISCRLTKVGTFPWVFFNFWRIKNSAWRCSSINFLKRMNVCPATLKVVKAQPDEDVKYLPSDWSILGLGLYRRPMVLQMIARRSDPVN